VSELKVDLPLADPPVNYISAETSFYFGEVREEMAQLLKKMVARR